MQDGGHEICNDFEWMQINKRKCFKYMKQWRLCFCQLALHNSILCEKDNFNGSQNLRVCPSQCWTVIPPNCPKSESIFFFFYFCSQQQMGANSQSDQQNYVNGQDHESTEGGRKKKKYWRTQRWNGSIPWWRAQKLFVSENMRSPAHSRKYVCCKNISKPHRGLNSQRFITIDTVWNHKQQWQNKKKQDNAFAQTSVTWKIHSCS